MSETTKQIDDGGAAFPQHGWSNDPETLRRMRESGMGMTLRDYLAAKAMQEMLASSSGESGGLLRPHLVKETEQQYKVRHAKEAYSWADAMIAAKKAVQS